jgi:hypothetical protein
MVFQAQNQKKQALRISKTLRACLSLFVFYCGFMLV